MLYFEVEGHNIPVKRYYENRRNVRVSIGKESILLRIPSSMSKADKNHYHQWAYDWLAEKWKKSRESVEHLIPTAFTDGDIISVMNKEYKLVISTTHNSTNKARIINDKIEIIANSELTLKEKSDTIKTLISRVMAKTYKNEVSYRLKLINEKYFGHNVKSIKLKYNRSNWGSCSSTGNINLSTRLLVAPEWVRDYVIVHELAHMNEMNHSKKYWRIVERVYPNYKKAEKWLKTNGGNCDFIPS